MASSFNLRAIISAVDRLSPVLNAQMRHMSRWRRQLNQMGKGAAPLAAGLGAAILIPARAFIEAEDAATQLKNTLMNKDGVAFGFEELAKVATGLGDKLPGTTADFMGMASQLKALGVSTDTITNGALKATAYLSVVGSKLGVTYESAADAVGTLGNALGIASKDLVPFADTLQRALHIGVDLGDLQYAMSQAAGPLKVVGQQGIKTANDLVPLIALLSQAGIKGENAGTGLKKLIGVATKAGKFTSIPALVHDLEKLQRLNPAALSKKLGDMFGEEHASKAAIIAMGGYDVLIKKFAEQASLEQRVANALGTLGNLWDAATGTFTNAMVAFTEAYAPELKQLAQGLNEISSKIGAWAKENGPMIKMILASASSLLALKLAAVGVAFGIGLITAAMRANPIMLLVQAIAIAAPFIYEHWGEITAFIKDSFTGAIDYLTGRWQAFINNIKAGINFVKSTLTSIGDWFTTPIFKDSAAALSAQRAQSSAQAASPRKSLVQSNRVSGGIDVNFNNAPQGTRVIPYKSKGPVAVTPNVGYRSLGLNY